MKPAALLALALLTLPAYADTYLCISEQAAFISEKDGAVLNAKSSLQNRKYLVDANGVRNFGEERSIIDQCNFGERGHISCDDGTMFFRFRMSPLHVFTVTGFTLTDDGTATDYIIKGKCSKISD